VRVLLVSTYDLGRQPTGLAAAAAALRRSGHDVVCVDASRERLEDDRIRDAARISVYLPMHTATRLAMPIVARVKRVNPGARVTAFGLYAQLNAGWLLERGVDAVEDEAAPAAFDRAGLPPLSRYASLRMPDGSRRVVGSTDTTRGCKHLCRHCPIVPVYRGRFRAIPADVVMRDVAAQVAAGAQHISFGDPDFLNGPSHARRIVERLAREHPGVTYDATIKVEHLLRHADLLPLLRDTGCLFVTTAVESVDDHVLARLAKGHTRADVARVVDTCRAIGLDLSPTFVPFTPWTSLDSYVDLLETIESLDLVGHVAPVQLAIRLLVTAGSPLLELEDIRACVQPFDSGSLTYPWRHADRRVDRLQEDVMRAVGVSTAGSRSAAFARVANLARSAIRGDAPAAPDRETPRRSRAAIPYLDEPWYC
jgi:radical SAM superfamily enzyme YgiQ (UPF0313 family)